MWEFIKENLWLIIGIVAAVIFVVMIIVIIASKVKTNKTVKQISIESETANKNQESEIKEEQQVDAKAEQSETVAEPVKQEQAEVEQTEQAEATKSAESAKQQEPEQKPAKKQAKTKKADETKQEPAKKTAKKEVKSEPVKEETKVEEPAKEETEVKVKNQKYMVTYDKERKDWVIKKTGAARASKRCKTKKEAMEIVERLAENQELNVSVKKKDGKFQKAENAKKSIKKDTNNQ